MRQYRPLPSLTAASNTSSGCTGSTALLAPQAMHRARRAGRCVESWLMRSVMVVLAFVLMTVVHAMLSHAFTLLSPHLWPGHH